MEWRWRLPQHARRSSPRFRLTVISPARQASLSCWLQSQNPELHLLPALPDAWQAGSVKRVGLAEAASWSILDWTDHRLKSAVIVARNAGDCVIRTSEP